MVEKLKALQAGLGEWLETPMDEKFKKQFAALPTKLNEFGVDDFGFSPEWIKPALLLTSWLYKYYFRVETYGIENIPEGRALLISNHTGQIPIDAVMISTAVMLEADPPRALRSMVERWASSLPYLSTFFTRVGQLLGTPENARALLERDEALLVFPEGTRGINKLWWERYRLKSFGPGFIRLALETKSPIVPLAVIGAEEQLPTVANFKTLARLLRMPAVPVMPQLLVPILGWVPLPTKYRIYFGEPIMIEGDANDEDIVIEAKAKEVQRRIQSLITYGLKNRKHVFW